MAVNAYIEPPEPVAVIGTACRLPGAADPDAFWQLLRDGRSAITETPADRWRDAPVRTRRGGFLERVADFDAEFFGVTPREASAMDPQQRLALELGWECLESTGIVPERVRGSRLGVFLGAIADDYARLTAQAGPGAVSPHTLAGLNRSLIANRLSYVLGARGVSMVVDTGQSSSLVAVHRACESLWSGESELALAGGVQLNLTGAATVGVEHFGALSPDGECWTFDARANGYVRGEGGAMVVLKPLARALADGDEVWCVIRGGAVNNDGGGPELTTPDPQAQREVIEAAYRRAGVDPGEVGYVELHGTGTRAGDPVEARALGAALGRHRRPEEPLPVGSVKTNLGHLEGAAGAAGLLKTVLALRAGELPASLNFRTPHPMIPMDELRLRVHDRLAPWSRPDGPLVAGVSSFGMGGTNCHLVLSSAPPAPARTGLVRAEGPLPFALSGRDERALRAQAGRLADWLRARPGPAASDLAMADLAGALATTRTAFPARAAVVADGWEALLTRLDALSGGAAGAGTVLGQAGAEPGAVALLFTGQGAQRLGMGRELHVAQPVFAEAFDEVCAQFDTVLDRPLREVLWAEPGSPEAESVHRTEFAQPGLFAVEVALYRLVTALGVRPAFLLGHSIGELAAAHAAGVLSLPDACTLVAARGRLMQALPQTGAMAAVEAGPEEVAAELEALAGRASLAAVNGPRAVVLSGEAEEVGALADRWRARGRRTRRLTVSHAFHSHLMDGMLDEFRAVARTLEYRPPRTAVVSNLTGDLATAAELCDPEYWVRHVRACVRFLDGVRRLDAAGVTAYLELGPDAVLAPAARSGLPEGRLLLSTVRADRPEPATVVEALAGLHTVGAEVDLPALTGAARSGGRRTALPTYAFQRRRHWLPEPDGTAPATPAPATPATPETTPPVALRQDPLDLVRQHTAAVLGLDTPAGIAPDVAFRDLGLTSATGVELCARLAAATGLPLPDALVYEHPTPGLLARHLALGAETADPEPDREPDPAPRRTDDDPIVIVGMACRFPGGVTSPDGLWRVVSQEVDAIGEFPADRGWDVEALYDPDPARRGSSYVREGGFLADVAGFDAAFFGISPREAAALDPQQRLLLETAWECLEHAGIDPASLRESDTGVFVGATAQEYGPRLGEPSDGSDGYLYTGSTPSVASGRIAYVLGLRGPALTVDTACSASLVALHAAARALREGECRLALAGGVTVMPTPGVFAELSRLGGLSPNGRSKAFAAAADGTGWAEGAGLLALERLSDARRHGHPVLAVVRGSAVNSDGASNGLTAPNGAAQQQVVRRALRAAGLTGAEVDAVEAHGTGTRLGDPIEARALLATYGHRRPAGRPLWLGSVKSNIGHTQSAAGVAGVIKMVQALRHGVLPRTLHVDEPTPGVDWSSGAVRLLTEPVDWPAEPGRPRRAGVSSFGISGTNAHLILEEAPPAPPLPRPGADGPPAWPLSARTPEALREQAARLRARLDETPAPDPADVAFTLLHGRADLAHRAVLVAEDAAGFAGALDALASGTPDPAVTLGTAGDPGRTVFVFPGHGSQWPGMAAELYSQAPAFAERLRECAAAVDPLVDWSLLDTLLGGPRAADPERTDVAQPVLFATMVSLAALWEAHGVRPDAVVGHSQGELAAACVAGVLTLPDAATVVVRRSRLWAEELPGRGMMAAVELSATAVRERIADRGARLDLAVVNGPLAVTVAGEPEEVERFVTDCKAEGIRARVVVRAGASHCALVEPLREPLHELIGEVPHHPPRIPFYSTVTAGPLSADGLDAHYWYRNAREPVDFQGAVLALLGDGHRTFVECSPHPLLSSALQDTAEEAGHQPTALGTLRREEGGRRRFLRSLAEAHVRGAAVDWTPTLAGTGARRTELPTYPFERRHHWLAPGTGTPDVRAAGLAPAGHPLLGAVLTSVDGGETVLTGRLSPRAPGWLADHAVGGTALLPGTAFIELALRAGEETGCPRIAELTVERPLLLPAGRAVDLRVTVGPPGGDGHGTRPVAVHARPATGEEEPWSRHAVGALDSDEEPLAVPPLTAWPPPGAEPVDVTGFYPDREADGYGYGPAFRGLRAAWRLGEEVYAEVALDPAHHAEARRHAVHPALLDAALHAELLRTAGPGDGQLRMPFAWTGVHVPTAGATDLRVRVAPAGGDAVRVTATDTTGALVAEVESLLLRPVPVAGLTAGPTGGGALYALDWQPLPPRPADGPAPGTVDLLDVRDAVPATDSVLAALQARAAEDDPAAPPLVVVTRHATVLPGDAADAADAADAPGAAEAADPAQGAVRGLVRSAQAEHPGRFLLLDADPGADERALRRAATQALAAGEDQAALRSGAVLAPRLVRAAGAPPTTPDPDGTVLITGGLGSLGAELARHLVATGARHLVLTGRRGEQTPGAAGLRAELAAAGARVDIRACDVADRADLTALLASLPAEHPLTEVYHLAAAVDDVPLEALTPERLAAVLRPKTEGALLLDELTRGHDLHTFVLFSSAVAVLGTPAQAAYAAANAALDALAHRRRAQGLPALSLAWGLWERESGLGGLADADLARLRRIGLAPMTTADGLALLTAALGSPRAHLIPAHLDLAALRGRAREQEPSPLLRALIRPPVRSGSAPAVAEQRGLAARLAALPRADQDRELLALVRAHAAAVLGLDPSGRDALPAERAFRESGFDSLTVVELRNRLRAATGLPLPTTLLFDHPTPRSLAAHLRERFLGADTAPVAAAPGPAAAPAVDEDPIAVVAMAGRFPGGVTGPEDLWRLVAEEVDAIGEFPEDRGWDLDRLFDPDPDRPGRSATRKGGFLYDAGEFDAALFGISPREALAMDPQQRLLLEVSWEAWERAGIPVAEAAGTRTGVFMGVAYHDYAARAEQVPDGVEGYLMTGAAGSVASGRIAYALGLQGPAITVDTACSSSLVALHLAVQSLRRGECAMALAGGVSVMAAPTTFVEFSRQQGLAVDGRCKSFGAGADGTGWSEGVGVLLVERLSDARRLGHPVLGLVRGSALNQDGASNGLTAPSGVAQERVIREAWANAGVGAGDVDLVEGHGTGTRLGDPIEAGALLATYGQGRGSQGPLWLGSLKSNLGHTQAAAGVAGVIKVLMAMRHERMPRTLHAEEPSREVEWSEGDVRLLAASRPWPREAGRARRAGVSSFGISGTNAHVILEEAPEQESLPARETETTPVLPFVVTAGSPGALDGQVERLAALLKAGTAEPLDVAYSLAATRSPLPYRTVAVARTAEDAVARLSGPAFERASGAGPLGLVFSGQGAQWAGMGRGLAAEFPLFGRVFGEVVGEFGAGVTAVAESGVGLERTEFAQPVLFAYQVALFRLLESWGVRPGVVAGHSVGEIAAAHVAGVLGLSDAVRLVGARGRLMGALPSGGVMVAVEAPEERVLPLLRPGVGIAAVNGPDAVVISGAETAVAHVVAALGGVRSKALRVSHAFHSPLMEPMLEEFGEVVAGLELRDPAVPFVSGLTGKPVVSGELSDPGYWVRHVREPVRFADAVASLATAGITLCAEVGPDGVLSGLIGRLPDAPDAVALGRRTGDEAETLLTGLGQLFAMGVPVDWPAFFDGHEARPTPLPTYAFDHQHYWITDGAPPRTATELTEPAEAAAPTAGLAEQLADLDEADRARHVLDTVIEQVAAVLGHAGAHGIDPERPFFELGFDSLTAVELRNRVNRISGLTLAPALVFDHPSPAALAGYLLTRLEPDTEESLDDLFASIDSELGPEAS